MVIELNILNLVLKSHVHYWSHTDEYLGKILNISGKLPIWKYLNFYGKWGSKRLKKFSDITDLKQNSTTWKQGDYIIASENVINPNCAIIITPKEGSIGIKVFITDDVPVVTEKNLLEELRGFCEEIYEEFRKVAIIGPRFNISISDLDYPRPRPPYNHLSWVPGSVVIFASKVFHQQHRSGKNEQLQKVIEASKEGLADRHIFHDDLLILQWVDDLTNGKKVIQGMTSHDLFFDATLELPVEGGYNKFGDEVEPYESLQNNKYLTFYDSFTKNGYKSTILNPDGSGDEDLLDELQMWIENESTPNGMPLNSLSLILPDRKSALQISEIAFSKGVSKVLYVDAEGQWYNPFPPGLWLT